MVQSLCNVGRVCREVYDVDRVLHTTNLGQTGNHTEMTLSTNHTDKFITENQGRNMFVICERQAQKKTYIHSKIIHGLFSILEISQKITFTKNYVSSLTHYNIFVILQNENLGKAVSLNVNLNAI